MSGELLGLIVLCSVLFALLAMGQYVAMAILGGSMVVMVAFYGVPSLSTVANMAFTSAFSWELASLPLFAFMGILMMQLGINKRLFKALAPLCSYLPGGLLNFNVIFSAIFAALCGSGSGGTAALTTIVVPEFQKRPQYRQYEVLGSIAGASNLSSLIPPSVPLISYGGVVAVSIGSLFMGGIIPGLACAAMFMGYIIISSLIRRDGQLERRVAFGRALIASLDMWPAIMLICLTLVTIYLGICTPSEAGAAGCFGALVLGLAFKELTWAKIWTATKQATAITGMIGLLFMASKLFSYVSSSLYLPQLVVDYTIGQGLSPIWLVVAILVIDLILGVIDGTIMIMMVVGPVFFPIIEQIGGPYGWDGVWLGVISVIMLHISYLSPPIGSGVFIISAFSKRSVNYIFRGCWPYLICLVVLVVFMVIFPEIITWLPNSMMNLGR